MLVPLTLELTTSVIDDRPVYISGNFNDWNSSDERFRMQSAGDGKFVFTFPADFAYPQPFEYKYNKGGWENVELDHYGNMIPNRTVQDCEGWVFDTVARWRSFGLSYRPELVPTIRMIDDDFEMPQLGRKRRVWALLPYDYEVDLERRYPVIYLQDAQNLFNDKNPFGNWAIDKKLAVLAEKNLHRVIVIAVDHGESERIDEFSPYPGRVGNGGGKNYVRFITESLKAYVDQHFRTLPDRNNTCIGGSSMGGLISIYAGLMHPERFGRLMVFSPSLWAAPKIYFNAIQFFNPYETKIYLYAGGQESADMFPNVQRFKSALALQGLDSSRIQFKIAYDPKGKHQESRWGEEFPKAVEWLFFDA